MPHPEILDYVAAKELLKSLDFAQKLASACEDSRYGKAPCGEFSIWSDGTLRILLVDEEGDYYGNNCIIMEHEECFDKWSNAPSVIRFPTQAEVVLGAIKFLGTPEGLTYSKKFIYYKAPRADVPREERHP